MVNLGLLEVAVKDVTFTCDNRNFNLTWAR